MASGYTVSGRGDLDTIFKARTGTARANVGYQVSGADLAQRFEQRGTSTPVAATGYLASGTDLAQLFMGKNTDLTLTAGVGSPTTSVGYFRGSYGSLSPSTLNGKNVQWMYDYQTVSPVATYFEVALDGGGSALTAAFFASVTINGKTYSTGAANFDTSNAPFYRWTWIGRAGLVGSTVYNVQWS